MSVARICVPFFEFAFAFVVLGHAACGGKTMDVAGARVDGGALDGSSFEGAAPIDAPVTVDARVPADECRVDSDCSGACTGPCVDVVCALGNDGFHHCVFRSHPPLTACDLHDSICCTADVHCTMSSRGHCVPYTWEQCAAGAPPPGNECAYDACASDADCIEKPNGFCTAAYPRTCRYGPCRTNADCNRGPDGRCVMQRTDRTCASETVFCHYSTDPCLTELDCKGEAGPYGKGCFPNDDGHGTSCKDRGSPPP